MNPKKLIKELEKQLKKDQDNLVLRLRLAAAYREVGRTADAVSLYRSVAVAYHSQGRLAQAIAVCRSVLEIEPAQAETQHLLAELDGMRSGSAVTEREAADSALAEIPSLSSRNRPKARTPRPRRSSAHRIATPAAGADAASKDSNRGLSGAPQNEFGPPTNDDASAGLPAPATDSRRRSNEFGPGSGMTPQGDLPQGRAVSPKPLVDEMARLRGSGARRAGRTTTQRMQGPPNRFSGPLLTPTPLPEPLALHESDSTSSDPSLPGIASSDLIPHIGAVREIPDAFAPRLTEELSVSELLPAGTDEFADAHVDDEAMTRVAGDDFEALLGASPVSRVAQLGRASLGRSPIAEGISAEPMVELGDAAQLHAPAAREDARDEHDDPDFDGLTSPLPEDAQPGSSNSIREAEDEARTRIAPRLPIASPLDDDLETLFEHRVGDDSGLLPDLAGARPRSARQESALETRRVPRLSASEFDDAPTGETAAIRGESPDLPDATVPDVGGRPTVVMPGAAELKSVGDKIAAAQLADAARRRATDDPVDAAETEDIDTGELDIARGDSGDGAAGSDSSGRWGGSGSSGEVDDEDDAGEFGEPTVDRESSRSMVEPDEEVTNPGPLPGGSKLPPARPGARDSSDALAISQVFKRPFAHTIARLAPDGAVIDVPLSIFSTLPEAALDEMARRMRLRHFETGDVIVDEGAPGDACFVVAHGEVRVLKRNPLRPKGAPVEVARLGDGALFGEFALLADRRRHATVQAVEPSEIYEIPRRLLRELAASHSEVGPALEAFYRERLLATLLWTAPFFKPLAEERRGQLLERFKPVRVESGARVVAEGQPAGGLYLIVLGSVEISKRVGDKRSVLLATLGEGAYFGEMSLLRGGVACASVTAVGPTELAMMSPRDFYEVVADNPRLWDEVRREANRRQLELHQLVTGETSAV